ncbi:MAG: DUF3782 domain-containing protein [Crocosphaera sp.]
MTTTSDDVWRLLGELTASQKETDRILQEQAKAAEKSRQEAEKDRQQTKRLFEETERRFRETEEILRKEREETDRQIKEVNKEIKEVNKQIKEVNKQIGNLGGKWGRFVENMVAPACETIFLNRGIPVHQVSQRVKKRLENKTLEIDVLVTNENHVLVVEVKSSLGIDNVKELINDLKEFRQFFPEYNQKQLYGAVAGIEMEEGADKYAYRQGLFVLVQTGETVSILNDEKFRPKTW